MKNSSILDSLKKIYTKMTGKKVVRRKTETDVLSDIAEAYDPNGGTPTPTPTPTPVTNTKAVLYCITGGYYVTVTFDCDDPTISTGTDLYNWLLAKGFKKSETNEYFVPACPIAFILSEGNFYGGCGMYVGTTYVYDEEQQQDVEVPCIYFDNGQYYVIPDDPYAEISITFLGVDE